MSNSSRSTEDSETPGFHEQEAKLEYNTTIAICLNAFSLMGTVFTAKMAVASISWTRAENFAGSTLLFLGIPIFVVQIAVFMPVVAINAKKFIPKTHGVYLVFAAILLPVVTLTSIAAGLLMAKFW